MRKHLFLLTTAVMLLLSMFSKAQTIYFQDGFEQGLDPAWTQEYFDIVSQQWVLETPDINQPWKTESGVDLQYPKGAAIGSGRAYFRQEAASGKNVQTTGYRTRLVTPKMDLSGYQPILRFYHAQAKWTADFDTLRVYYRQGTGTQWKLLREFTSSIQKWTFEELDLPLTGENYQIAFEASENMGRGIVLDEVIVRTKPQITTPHDLSFYDMRDNGVNVTWEASKDADAFRVVVSTIDLDLNVYPSNLDSAAYIVMDTVISSEKAQDVRVENLAGGHTYYMQAQSIGEFENSVWSETFSFRIKPVVNITANEGYFEDFNIVYKSNEVKDMQLETWTWGGDKEPVIPTWIGVENYYMYSPDASAAVTFIGENKSSSGELTYSIPTGVTSYIASPEISGKNIPNFEMSMCHVTFWGTTYKYQHNRARAIIVGIMTDPEDLTTFVPVDTCQVWGYTKFTYFDVDLSSYTGSGRYVAFASNFQDQENWFALDKVTIEVKPAIAAINANDVKVIPSTSEAQLSWPAVPGASTYKVKYMAMENKGKIIPLFEKDMVGATTVTAETNTITLSNLTNPTKYVFCIQAVGADANSIWSQPKEFYTSAEMQIPKKYEFEESEGRYYREGEAVTELYPRDWCFFTNDADAPYLYTSYYRSGSRCLYMIKDQYNEAWTVAPMIEDVKQVELVLYARLSSTSYRGSNIIVGVMEDPSDMKTFTPITTFAPADVTYERFYANFVDYKGTGKYIALVWGESGTSKNGICVDDLTFRDLADCRPPVLNIQVTDSSAVMTWTRQDETHRYDIKLSAKVLSEEQIPTASADDLLKLVESYDGDSIVFTGLDYATAYYVYVQAVCSPADRSEWSGTSFTTECPESMKLPYKTSFEKEATGTIPQCWIKPTWTTTTSTYPYVSSSTNAHSGGQYLYMTSSTTYGSTIALPKIDADLENVKLRFWLYYSSSNYKVFTGIMGDPNDPEDFYPVDTFTTVASTWILCESMFKAEDLKNGQYLAISSFTGASNYVYVDDVEVINVINEPPFNYKKVDGGTDWFEVQWDGKTTEQWNVIVSDKGYQLADTVNPLDTIPTTSIIANTQTAANGYKVESGLSALTWYYIYAKSTASNKWSMDSIQTECTTWNPRVKTVQGFETDSKGNNIRTVTYSLSSTATYVSYFQNAITPECWTVGNGKWGTDLSKATTYTYRNYFPYICTDGAGTSATPTAYAEKSTATNQYSSDGVNSLKVYGSYSSSESSNYAPAWAAMNKLECSDEDLKSLILTFDYAMATTASYAVIVGIMDDPTDLSTFTVLDSVGPGLGTGSHKHKSVEISLDKYEGTGRYIAFRTPMNKTTTFYLDNVSVSLATCPNPSPSMSQITENSAVVASGLRVDNGWKYIVTDSMYQSTILDAGTMPAAEHIVAQEVVEDEGDGAPKMRRITGLTGNTTYYVYAVTLCENNETSAWKMVEFTTLCDPVDVASWVGNFENDTTVAGYKPECWTVGSLTAGAANTYIPYVVSTTRAEIMDDPASGKVYNKDSVVSGAKVLRLYAYGTATSITSAGAYAITPGIKLPEGKSLSDYQVMFKGYGTSGQSVYTTTTSYRHNLRVGVINDPSDLSTMTIVDTVSLPTNTQQCIVELSSYTGTGKYIVFLLEKEDLNYSQAFIYDIHVDPIPACKVPNSISIDEVGESFIKASWKGNSSTYNVAVSSKFYTDDEKAAGYLVNDSVIAKDGIIKKTSTEASITFDGLTANTEYYLYVQGVCGTDTTLWAYESPLVHTNCPAEMPAPLKENFEKYATSVTAPDCWEWADYGGTGYPKVMNPTSGATSGHQYELWSTGTTHRTVVMLPKVAGNLSDYVFSMDARSYSTSTATVVYVGTMKDINDSTTFAPLDTFYMENGNEFTKVEMVLKDYNLVYDRIAITSGLGTTLEKASDIYIDNVRLGLPISCFAPTELTISNEGLSSAELTFTPADSVSNKWEIELTKAGGEPQKFTTNQPSFQFTGLESASSYSVIVRTVCDEDYSDFTDAVTFNTQWEIDTYKWSFNLNEQGTISNPNKPSAAVATYAVHPALISTASQATLDYSSNTTYLPYQIANTSSLAYAQDKRDFVAGKDTARALRLYRYFSSSYAYGDSAAVLLPYIINPQGKQMSMDIRFGYAYTSNHSTAANQNVWSTIYPAGVLCIGTVDSIASGLATFKEITRVYAHGMMAADTLREASNYGWMHYVLPLDMDLTGKKLALMIQSPVTANIYIDNLAIEAAEGITTPVMTSISAGDTYATLNWTGNANSYNIYVVDTAKISGEKSKYIPYIEDAPAGSVDTILNVTGNSYKVTGLNAGGNTYAFYVEDAAKVGQTGALSNRKFATTVCQAIQIDGSYTYDFEPGPNYQMGANPSKSTADGFTFQWPSSTTAGDTVYKTPECWNVGITYSSYDPTSTTYKSYNPTLRSNSMTAAAASQYKYARNGYSCMQFYGTSTYKEVYAVMPLMSGFDMDTMEVNFWGRCTYEKVQGGTIYTVSYLKGTSYSTKMAVGTMSDPLDPSTFVALDTIEYDYTANDMSTSTVASSDPTGNSYWLNFTVPMKGATGQYIAFKQVGNGYFYMDDLSIRKRQTARRPRNVEVSEIGSTSATVSWNGMENGGKYVVELSSAATNWESAKRDTVTAESIVLAGLGVAQEYFVRVKQIDSEYGNTEFAHYVQFSTECEALNPNGYKTGFECDDDSDPYTVVPGATGTNVNTMKQNQCWTYINLGTTQTVSSTYFPYNIANTSSSGYSHSGGYALKLNAYSTTYQMCVVSPYLDAEIGEAGKGFDTLQVSFWACPTYHGLSGTNKDKISSASGTTYGKYIEIGTCTDPADTSTYTVLQGWTYEVEGDNLKTGVQADASNDYAFRKVTVKLNNATGNHVFIRANKVRELGDGKSFTYSTMYIDDLQFETLLNCPEPANLKATDVTIHDAKIQWESEAMSFDIQVSEDPTFSDAEKMLVDTIGALATNYAVEGLEPNKQYFYRVKAYCDAERKDASDWTTVANFTTPYSPLYTEDFTMNLSDWKMGYGYANKVFSGEIAMRDTTTSGTYNSWYRVQNLALSGYAVRMLLGYAASTNPTYPISSTYQGESYLQKYWLVSPSITIEKENAQLAFEAALTNYTTANPIYAHDHWNEGWDDQFMVIISDDNGATWKRENATIWNNEKGTQPGDSLYKYGQGDYVLTDIPATPTQLSVDLNKYAGKTIRIAFYGENTVQNAMNAIHVDKIHVNYLAMYQDSITLCQFEDVDDVLGFNINGDSVPAGSARLKRSILSYENGTPDSLFVLDVTYKEAPQYYYEVTICEGTPFEYMGFNQHTAPGTYRMKLTSQVTGCDSIVNFTIKHSEALRTQIDTSICQGAYINFMGKKIYEAGTYIDTLRACELYGACDSIVTLNLTLRATNHIVIPKTILHGETYQWFDQELTETVTKDTVLTNMAGCDSTVTLNLTVKYADPVYSNQSICQGDTYTWQGKEYSQAGTYYDTVRVAGQADQILGLVLKINQPSSTNLNVSILHGEVYDFGGKQLSESGTYVDTIPNILGCDSVVTLNLTVKYADPVYSNQSICQGDTYTWQGKEYSQAGTYYDTVRVAGQADQILGLVLKINQPNSTNLNVSILHGEVYDFGGKQLSESGTYVDTIPNILGCDSVVTLNLTVKYADPVYSNQSICQGDTYTWQGKEYSKVGTYYDTVRVAGQADQILGLVLKINQPSKTNLNVSILHGESYQWFNEELTESVVKDTILTNAAGCDSTVTLNLTVKYANVEYIEQSICEGESYTTPYQKTYSKAGTYLDTIQVEEQADKIYGLILTVNQPSLTNLSASILHGESYQWYDELLTESVQKDTVLTNVAGCDSVVTLNLTVTYAPVQYLSESICKGDTFMFNGKAYTQAGIYQDTVVVAGQPDQIVSLNLTVNQPSKTNLSASIMHGESYPWYDELLTESVVKDTILTNVAGCDSVVTLNLTVTYAPVQYLSESICMGDTYTFNGKAYTQAGIYQDTVVVAGQPDQIVSLNLTVNQPSKTNLSASIMHGESYPWYDELLTESVVKDTILTNAAGCDSVVTLNLIVTYAPVQYLYESICMGDTYTFNGKTYSQTGTYVDTIVAAGQPDQIVSLTLSIHAPSAYEYADEICAGEVYNFNGKELTESGTYIDTIPNVHGCDSIITLRLTVNQPINEEYNVAICAGSTYLFGGKEISVPGQYLDTIIDAHGCNAIVTLNLTVNEPLTGRHYAEFCGETYFYQGESYAPGTYEVMVKTEQGCDSLVTLVVVQTTDVHDTLNVTLCSGETYSDEDFTVNKPGTYYSETVQSGGCTIYRVLNFAYYDSVKYVTDTVFSTELPYTYLDLYYDEDTEAGTYREEINTTGPEGCALTIYHSLTVIETQDILDVFVENKQTVLKVMYRHQMYFVRPDGWYTISGQKVECPVK